MDTQQSTTAEVKDPFLRFLNEDQCKKVHQATLELLERTGVWIGDAACLEMLRGAGARVVEFDEGVDSVGLGGLPDRDGKVTLDAAIMRGPGEVGSVHWRVGPKYSAWSATAAKSRGRSSWIRRVPCPASSRGASRSGSPRAKR